MTKRSKYNASKLEVDGERFDSKKEYKRWLELRSLEEQGEISELRRQEKHELIPSQKVVGQKTLRAVYYVADFVYIDKDGNKVVEDVKGYRGGGAYAVFRIKAKLMMWVHGIYVKEK